MKGKPNTHKGKMGSVHERLTGDERGFTLPEMLTTIMIMIVVFFAIYSLFDSGIRLFSLNNDRIEAIENARVGLERMEREIRMAYPIYHEDDEETPSHIFFASTEPDQPYLPTSERITFFNDLDGDRLPNDDGGETIEYYVEGDNLVRNQGGSGGQPVVSLGPTGEFRLSYLDGDGDELCGDANPTCSGIEEFEINVVRITLEVDEGPSGEPRTQTLTTDMELRNRG